MKFDFTEDFKAGHEMHFRAATLAFASGFQRRYSSAVTKLHLMRLAITANGQPQPFRQRVNYRDAHAMQTTGNFVGVAIEFTARMKLGHNNFCGGAF